MLCTDISNETTTTINTATNCHQNTVTVSELKNQKSVVDFEQKGCIFHLYAEQKPLGRLCPNFVWW